MSATRYWYSQSISTSPGIWIFELDGAAGGPGCDDNEKTFEGGRGSYMKIRIKVTDYVDFWFDVGTQPPTFCDRQNSGGTPGGGSSGKDSGGGSDDHSGGGGGYTAIYYDGKPLAIAAGGAGGCNDLHGSNGGGIGYVLKVIDDENHEREFRDGETMRCGTRNGGNGEDYYYTPGAGGGGGWCGGVGGGQAYTNHYKAAAAGGSCGYQPWRDSRIIFGGPERVIDGRSTYNTGNGDFTVDFEYVCDAGCKDCEGEHNCRQCFNGFYMYGTYCYQDCRRANPRFYNSPNGKCEWCSNKCKTCWGSATSCTSCWDGQKLVNGQCVQLPTIVEGKFQSKVKKVVVMALMYFADKK